MTMSEWNLLIPELCSNDTVSKKQCLFSLCLVVEIILYPVKARDFASSDNIPFIILYFKMNSCKKYSFNDIRFEALQVIHTLTETYFTFIISSSTIIKRLILIFVRKECLTLFYWK